MAELADAADSKSAGYPSRLLLRRFGQHLDINSPVGGTLRVVRHRRSRKWAITPVNFHNKRGYSINNSCMAVQMEFLPVALATLVSETNAVSKEIAISQVSEIRVCCKERGRDLKSMMAKIIIAVLVGILCESTANSASGEWNLRRNVGNGACSVQPIDSLPQLGEFLAKSPTRKAACEEAKARHTDDSADTTKCYAYTPGTIDECKRDSVDLAG